MFQLNAETAKAAVYGGWFLGGGGGGRPADGLRVGQQALEAGTVTVMELSDFADGATVMTAALVGSPAADKGGVGPAHCRRVMELFEANGGTEIAAIIANEAGGQSITNGWLAAASCGIPMLDAACNGRAHPTGVMGAMHLDTVPGYRSLQAAAGGAGECAVELFASGSIDAASKLVREAANQCGGFVTVLRNPAPMSFVRENCAVGALSQCIEVGRLLLKHENRPEEMLRGLQELLDCREIGRGVTHDFRLETRGGFDVGSVLIGENAPLEVTFWNEYMTAERDDARIATFPDLIMLLDSRTGLPLCSAALQDGLDVIAVTVPKDRLLLSTTMADERILKPCETAVCKEILRYLK